MGDSNSPELPIPAEGDTSGSWSDIRNQYLRLGYSEIYKTAMQTIRTWEQTPRQTVEVADWQKAIQEQVDKAKSLPSSKRQSAKIYDSTDVNKISAIGNSMPPFGREKTTRVYVGTDPRRATDAYIALLDGLEASDVLKDINASLFMEVLKEGKVKGNTIIIYDPLSRPEVLDKILEAYRNAKQNEPSAFSLTPRQRAAIMRENLRNFHATIDANMSFVEQPATRKGASFDTDDRFRIQQAFGCESAFTDKQWLDQTSKKAKGVVFTYLDIKKITDGQAMPGDILHYERKLSAPALVQEGTRVVNG